MGKKVLVLGTGAQGTTVAKRLQLEPNVDKIILGDYDEAAVKELAGELDKAEAFFCDASKKENIMPLIEGCDLVVNALPLAFGKNVIDAALEAKCNYQDFAAPEGFEDTWEKCMYRLLTEYNEKFKAIGKLAIMGTGSAPGTMCVVARDTMKDIDECDTIFMNVYEGVEAKRFQPYWWSPVTALNDMDDLPVAWIDGKMVNTKPFSLPIERTYDYVGYPVRFVEHAHDEPFYVGMRADDLFKGCKNAYFKYGGVGIEFAEPLARAGLLKRDPVEIDGQMVNTHEVILKFLPSPPRFAHEVEEIIKEGDPFPPCDRGNLFPTFSTVEQFAAWLEKHLRAGRVVLAEWSDWDGHWVCLIGLDNNGTPDFRGDDVLILADPYDTMDHWQDGYTAVPIDRFFYLWKDRAIAPKPYQLQPFIVVERCWMEK